MTDPRSVTVRDRVWLVEKWVDVFGGHSLSQIVMSHEYLAKQAEADGWTVTEYVRVDNKGE